MNQLQRVIKEKLAQFKKENGRPFIAGFDFDGTITIEDRFPLIGEVNPEIKELILFLKECEVYLILWTCRSGNYLEQAKNWCEEQGMIFDKYNEHSQIMYDKYYPNISQKVYFDLYIDDKAFNIKSIFNQDTFFSYLFSH